MNKIAHPAVMNHPAEGVRWQDLARCTEVGGDVFFPEKGGSTRDAKKICAGCEVVAECLEDALRTDERFGIRGGLSERQRRKLKQGAA